MPSARTVEVVDFEVEHFPSMGWKHGVLLGESVEWRSVLPSSDLEDGL
jgi:hypothetical protein